MSTNAQDKRDDRHAEDPHAFEHSSPEELVRRMTLKEKVSLLAGLDDWRTVPVERLGIPSITMTDGPHGVRANFEHPVRPRDVSTAFPSGVSMAASWNTELIRRVGFALAEETRALGCNILLGPCVNIVRQPPAGRNFETYSEDPYLAGRIGVAWVSGLQSNGVGASVKHFACNNQEDERMRGSSEVDEQTLREIYLPAFEAIVTEAGPWTVMCAYNRINGVYASENTHLLREILKDEWGFEGFVVSDWGAVHSTAAPLKAGLDLEMPGPARHFGDTLQRAVDLYQVEESEVDDAARRVVGVIKRATEEAATAGPGALNTGEHQELAREVALEAITLLKNDGGALPLASDALGSIAVIGPNAADLQAVGSGSSFVESPYVVSPIEALRAQYGGAVAIEHEPGCDNYEAPPVIPRERLTPASGDGSGLVAEIFEGDAATGEPLVTSNEGAGIWWGGRGPADRDRYHVRLSGSLTVPESGTYALYLESTALSTLTVGGDAAASATGGRGVSGGHLIEHTPSPDPQAPAPRSKVTVQLSTDSPAPLTIETTRTAEVDVLALAVRLERVYTQGEDDRIERAVALARRCDAAVVFAGMAAGYETEGGDRPHISLPNRQDELIAAVAGANRRTVVVLNAGSPVAMPWIDRVAAVVLAYYPGMEGGTALAQILSGQVSPSGKLPVTFPLRIEDTPSYLHVPGGRRTHYGERLFVGYRYYDRRDLPVLFPFGHGLTYSECALSEFKAPGKIDFSAEVGPQGVIARAAAAAARKPDAREDIVEPSAGGNRRSVAVTVSNNGEVAVSETTQLYVARRNGNAEPRPAHELRGFRKVQLAPGESVTVSLPLGPRMFARYDRDRRGWVVDPGEYELRVGFSSRDIRARVPVRIDAGELAGH